MILRGLELMIIEDQTQNLIIELPLRVRIRKLKSNLNMRSSRWTAVDWSIQESSHECLVCVCISTLNGSFVLESNNKYIYKLKTALIIYSPIGTLSFIHKLYSRLYKITIAGPNLKALDEITYDWINKIAVAPRTRLIPWQATSKSLNISGIEVAQSTW